MPSNMRLRSAMKLAGSGAKLAHGGTAANTKVLNTRAQQYSAVVRSALPSSPTANHAAELADSRKESALLRHQLALAQQNNSLLGQQLAQSQQDNATIRAQIDDSDPMEGVEGPDSSDDDKTLRIQVLALDEQLERERSRHHKVEAQLKSRCNGLEQRLYRAEKAKDAAVSDKLAAEQAKSHAVAAQATAQKAAADAAKVKTTAQTAQTAGVVKSRHNSIANARAKALASADKARAAATAKKVAKPSEPAPSSDEAGKGGENLAADRLAAMSQAIEKRADQVAEMAGGLSKVDDLSDLLEDPVYTTLIDASLEIAKIQLADPSSTKTVEPILARKVLQGHLDKVLPLNTDFAHPFDKLSGCVQGLAKGKDTRDPKVLDGIAKTPEFADAISSILSTAAQPLVTPEERMESIDESVQSFVDDACGDLKKLFPQHQVGFAEAVKPLYREAFQHAFLHHATRIRKQYPDKIKSERVMDHLPTS